MRTNKSSKRRLEPFWMGLDRAYGWIEVAPIVTADVLNASAAF